MTANPRLLRVVEDVRTSFVLLPLLMSATAIALGYGLLEVDARRTWDPGPIEAWLYSGTADGARSVLGSLAGSMIAVTGTVFSITVVALSFASGQLGPRLLRNFTGDRVVQSVLGTFVATFLFCLTVLSGLDGGAGEAFVPRLAISAALVLAVLAFVVLIYFIHHIARSLQVDFVIRDVRRQLDTSIERLYPVDREPPPEPEWANLEDPSTVCAESSGYVLAIDYDELVRRAQDGGWRIECVVRAGHFLGPHCPLLLVEGKPTEAEAEMLRRCVGLAPQRTPAQDVEYSVRQLVEIGLRALSPGVNDPFTAITCIDQLSASVGVFAARDARESVYFPRERPTVTGIGVGFEELMDAAWNQLRQHGAAQVAVAMRMLEGFARIARGVGSCADAAVVERHAKMVAEECLRDCAAETDRLAVAGRMDAVRQHLGPRMSGA